MKKLFMTGTALLLVSSSAMAADLSKPPPAAPVYTKAPLMPVFSWTGFYIGGNLGGHWSSDSQTTTTDPRGWAGGLAASIDATVPGTLNTQGVIGGGQIGFNWQTSNVVWGLEADIDGMSGSATRSITNIPLLNTGDVFTSSQSTSTYLATFRARLGLAFDRWLVYGTGGAALTDAKFTDSMSQFAVLTGTISTTTVRAGWTAGGGLEYALTNNWTIRGEGLYADFGTIDNIIPVPAGGTPNSTVTVHHRYTEVIGRGAINYKFGP